MMDDRPHTVFTWLFIPAIRDIHITRDRKSSRASIDDEAFKGKARCQRFFSSFHGMDSSAEAR